MYDLYGYICKIFLNGRPCTLTFKGTLLNKWVTLLESPARYISKIQCP